MFGYERALNFKFVKAGPPTPKQVSEACAQFASRRLRKVSPSLVKHFSVYAKEMLGNYNPAANEDDANAGSIVTGIAQMEPMEELLARCLAAISNREAITCRWAIA